LWRLRGTLSHDPGIFWLGASYQALETEHAYQDAFWDFFELVELRPLQVAEMRQAMLALARTFGAGRGLTGEDAEREMARNLDARPERLKALRAITGGNPRTTVMLYELFAAGGADDVHSDLRRLLDTMTPLYKARMEALSDQSRKLLAHLMEHWAPISARDLGQVSGIATNTVSGQLGRLEAEGLVEKAALAGTKRAGYQASERLFNVWYLMRYASRRLRQRLTWLVEFMRLWYSGDELTELARQRAGQHGQGRLCRGEQLEFSRALSLALPDSHADHYRLDWAVFRAARRTPDRTRADLGELFELDGEDREYATADDYLPRFEALDARLALCPHLTDATRGPWIEAVKSSLSLTLPEKEHIADAAKDLTERAYLAILGVLQYERDRWAQEHGEAAAGAVWDAVLAGHFFPDCPDSKLAYNQIMGCFGESPQAIAFALRLVVANHQDTWCEKVVRHALDLDSENARSWDNLGILLSKQPGRRDEAEAAYRRAAELDPKYARPWNGLGLLLGQQPGRGDEAEAAYRRAAELDPSDPYPAANLARLFAAEGRRQEADAAYRQAATLAQATDEQGPGAETPPLDQCFGHAHVLLQAHLWLGNRDLALQALDHLTEAAAAGDRDAFYRLKEQARECQHIGLGSALKGLMEASAWADFLQPFALALGAAALDVAGDALAGAPPELRTLAEEILAELRPASSAGEQRSAQLGPRG
jgi:tetratricopeptide (TPR) repeat protein